MTKTIGTTHCEHVTAVVTARKVADTDSYGIDGSPDNATRDNASLKLALKLVSSYKCGQINLVLLQITWSLPILAEFTSAM